MATGAGLLVAPQLAGAADGMAQIVAERARAEAKKPYLSPRDQVPAELKALSYDQVRDIRYRPDHALWRQEGLPFEVMFFHLGKYATQPVFINEVDGGHVRRIGFDSDSYDYGQNQLAPKRWGDLGHAGFRVHYALNNNGYKDELVVFLGASYFRALGADQQYGLSARGLAIDTVGGSGEEFPRFKEFWIEKPTPGASSLVIHALLDSSRLTGAYRFTVRPGTQTITDVSAQFYLRAGAASVATLGIAPLTSMFLHGENAPHPEDFRPEVHDSDGLMVASGDGQGRVEWLWRPLINPKQQLVTSFASRDLKGYGLMQRDRTFRSYEDIEARYERRPSAWIVPQGQWGPGRVELMQFPTPDETHDNVVAYWVPDALPAPGQPLSLSWQVQWQGADFTRPPNGYTLQSRRGRGFDALSADETQYVVDFTGPALDALPIDATVDAVVTVGRGGELVERNAYRNPATGAWRMTLRIKQDPSAKQPVELRAFLQHGTHALTETWTTLLPAL